MDTEQPLPRDPRDFLRGIVNPEDLFLPNRDWTYSEGCGCRVTFFVASEYHTSRMLPGETCETHTARHQTAERDTFVENAKRSLKVYLERGA